MPKPQPVILGPIKTHKDQLIAALTEERDTLDRTIEVLRQMPEGGVKVMANMFPVASALVMNDILAPFGASENETRTSRIMAARHAAGATHVPARHKAAAQVLMNTPLSKRKYTRRAKPVTSAFKALPWNEEKLLSITERRKYRNRFYADMQHWINQGESRNDLAQRYGVKVSVIHNAFHTGCVHEKK